MDGWNTSFLLEWPFFQVRNVSFRECIFLFNSVIFRARLQHPWMNSTVKSQMQPRLRADLLAQQNGHLPHGLGPCSAFRILGGWDPRTGVSEYHPHENKPLEKPWVHGLTLTRLINHLRSGTRMVTTWSCTHITIDEDSKDNPTNAC